MAKSNPIAVVVPSVPSLPRRLDRLAFAVLGICLAGLPLFFYTLTQDQFELPKLVFLRCLSSAIFGLLLASFALDPARPWRRSALDLPVLAWAVWLIVCTVTSFSPALSTRGEYENFAGSLTQLNYCLLYFLTLQLAPSLWRSDTLLRFFELGALSAALYALLQAMQRDFIGWASSSIVQDRFFSSMGNPNFLGGLMAMAIPLRLARLIRQWDQSPASSLWQRDGIWRAAGLALWLGCRLAFGKDVNLWTLLPGQDLAATFAFACFVISLAAAPWLRRKGRLKAALAVELGADLLVLFQALSNTATRGAFAGLMAALLFMALAWPLASRYLADETARVQARRHGLRLGAGLLLALVVAFVGLGSKFRERMSTTLLDPAHAIEISRLQIWGPALEIWKERPLIGTGVDTFKSVFPSHSRSRFARYDGENVSSRMAHNEPLHVLATMGSIGLGLWLGLCAALFWQTWARLRRAGDNHEAWRTLGLGGLFAGYLVQNLVSFGVSAISAPFFALAALLFSGVDVPAWRRQGPTWPAPLALALALGIAGGGATLATRTWIADRDYALGNTVQNQVNQMTRASFEDSRSLAAYALTRLRGHERELDPLLYEDVQAWVGALSEAEPRVTADPAAAARETPLFQQGAASLLLAYSVYRQEHGVSLCPNEVKYVVYLGLSYEELFKRTVDPRRREAFFNRALAAYTQGTLLNPRNAYYQGNIGRLWGMGAEAGNWEWMKKAETAYLAALALAPVTKLFYQNVLLLYARFGMAAETEALLQKVVDRDKELAPVLLKDGASTLYHWTQQIGTTWPKDKQREALRVALKLALLAAQMDLSDGDSLFLAGVIEDGSGNRKRSAEHMKEALKRKPGDLQITEYMKQRKL